MHVASLSLRCLFGVLLLTGLNACAPAPIYKAAGNVVVATPQQVAATPERYAGGSVIWGGTIVQVNNYADHSEVELLAYPLDSSQRPKIGDVGNGRVIAVMNGYVEPLDYPIGAPITVSGKLDGSRAGHVGEANYSFPLLSVNQSHVWSSEEMQKGRNNIHFGLGVGVGIR